MIGAIGLEEGWRALGLCVFNLIGTLLLVVANAWQISFGLPPLGVAYLVVARYYRASSRELQRIDSVSKSPIYAAFSEALQGATSIVAFGATRRFGLEARQRLDANIKAIGNAIIAGVAALAVGLHAAAHASGGGGAAMAAGLAGLSLSGGRVVVGDRRIPSYGGEYRYAREDKDVDNKLTRAQYLSMR
ncbi:hypothetical protein EMIHUDRAFT_228550 [Emiliania huxleyi CCMP1516]|uniref:ABC transmembrane type-1 domain-containing protein n=2 Tax=Emiliania huxleyi TaxID=2903 RepID=A0A0D3KFN0_EMIH1|nr:hypothetical protein EMIHUDRAFT_228550 [Emiliania huxleyi CCMP1516]EOD34565.1 hypothetical protein EMIHUDRAFT_228550 [Emiliania huxleyi CCMP1516]|eukprot:XP_005786994.1 hypothetical protein EMIHUDRAFT_228550 [Emiliania huxleyi CCMP1516]